MDCCVLLRFAPGDVVMMYPKNALEDVQQLCDLLRLDPEARFTLKASQNTAGVVSAKQDVCEVSIVDLIMEITD